jgi:hypothetical protein
LAISFLDNCYFLTKGFYKVEKLVNEWYFIALSKISQDKLKYYNEFSAIIIILGIN